MQPRKASVGTFQHPSSVRALHLYVPGHVLESRPSFSLLVGSATRKACFQAIAAAGSRTLQRCIVCIVYPILRPNLDLVAAGNMVEMEDGKGGAPQAKAAPGTGKGKWPPWSQGNFFYKASRPRTPEGQIMLMAPDLHRAARKAWGARGCRSWCLLMRRMRSACAAGVLLWAYAFSL